MKSHIELFGIKIDPLTMAEAVRQCIQIQSERRTPMPYVVTPNMDHIVNLQSNSSFHDAYSEATLVLVDGKPVKAAMGMLGRKIPEVVPGSDLVPAIFDSVQESDPITVFLLGAADGVAERAAANIDKRWSGVNVVGCYSPPFGFEKDQQEQDKMIDMISKIDPDLLVVGLGAPKQEVWVWKNRAYIKAGIALCVGATIDFLAGEKKRAPVFLRKLALEWLYRIYTDPKRLAKRYFHDAIIFPRIVWKEWKKIRE
jgi:N-acetylglucosaminyldiphosphoundecaprenol N-acetyl-beta-D-mannosaminyltransferase